MIPHVDVAVVGAGVTGLAAAWAAEQKGATVAVVEAGANCGGSIQSQHIDGFLVERGASSMTGSAALMRVLGQLGLRDEVVVPPTNASRRFIVRNSKLCPLPSSPLGLLTTPALTWRGKMRALREPWVAQSQVSPEFESVAAL
ncbi:MAG: FAD-dependent oxidoreductase, partial [Phycisphaerae bacterium]|nr:FAD-dependent oxidoreductase [Gemmatimonadaceae bacterium]